MLKSVLRLSLTTGLYSFPSPLLAIPVEDHLWHAYFALLLKAPVKSFPQHVMKYRNIWKWIPLCRSWMLTNILIFLIPPVQIFWIPMHLWGIKIISLCQCPGILILHVHSDSLVDVPNTNGKRTDCKFLMKLWKTLTIGFRKLHRQQNVNIFPILSQIIVIDL